MFSRDAPDFIRVWPGWGFVMMMGRYIKGNTKVAFCEISFGWLTLERLGILAGIVIGVIAMAISKHALTISKWGILPDIELRYEIKKIAPEYITDPIQQHFINNNSEAYGDFYSHLTLFNGGNGKASNIKTEYNWIVSGRKGGISEDAIKKQGTNFSTMIIFSLGRNKFRFLR